MRGSRSTRTTARPKPASRYSPPQDCGFRPSADLAGRAVALSPDIPAVFDAPLAAHHKLVGHWVLSQENPTRACTRFAARRHVERTFEAAVLDVLAPLELVDLRVAVLLSEEDGPPAIAIVCESMGQLDLGWIETSDAPIAWRAAAYHALEHTLGRALPVFGYQDLFDEISMYYWEGATDDEAARECLIAYHGVDEETLDGMTLPSEMNERRPEWMIAANAAPSARLPKRLRRKLADLRKAYKALGSLTPERNAWHLDFQVAYEYLPGIEECASLPPLTLVPFEQFTRELDTAAQSGMEMGFMDIAGICPLPEANRIDEWFASLRCGAAFLKAAQDIVQFVPPKPRGSHD
ncbi:hypothetical protein K3M67_06475 [Sphingobium sp. V4]|uniref:hypothetical protein n=1 Tax=Sphingobium sp. V4 TaxID=3038927 RepID=UPI002557FD35|nr:hypothetical protein [Sphingobium sp. V4]WIW89599.1 hypothetical protein K3M67_06475 [Sphingobium sp. V4]